MSATRFLELGLLGLASAFFSAACTSTGPTMPVECGAGTVTCEMDNICCPSSDAFYCGGPLDPDNLGCYPTLKDAQSVCGSAPSPVTGKNENLAYACH